MTLAEKIVELLQHESGLSDREITNELFGVGKSQQSVNATCNKLEKKGILTRQKIGGNPIGNYLTGKELHISSRIEEANINTNEEHFSEDGVKEILEKWLMAQDWKVSVAWGRERGIDVDAINDNKRWIIEVKGQGKSDQARGNNFLSVLGETLQRMNDKNIKYSIGLPNIQRYRNLWERFPSLANSRRGITALFVDNDGNVKELY